MFTFPIKYEIIGFFNKEILIGFSLLLLNSETVFLVLLAIDKKYSGNGYGSQAFRSIISKYPEKQIVLDFEEVVNTALNYEQRVERKQFNEVLSAIHQHTPEFEEKLQ